MRVVRVLGGAAIAAVILPLAGCSHVPDAVNPIAWYRDVAGTSKADAEDANQRNQQNLEAGGKQPYPNLATVPNVPNGATSTIDREKLVKGLIADRTNAKYNNEQLQAGSQLASIAPPPPPLKLAPPSASPTAAANAPTNAATATTTAAPSTSNPQPAASAPAATPAKSTTKGDAHEAPPEESTLTSPTIQNVPTGQAPPAPPPPANVARTTPPPAPTVAAETPSSPPPSTGAVAPLAAPVNPTTSSAPAGVRAGGQPSLAMRTPATAANPVSVSVGDIAFAEGSSDLAETQRSALAEIAGLYKQTGGEVRIVGHAEPGHSSDAIRQRIAGLDLALDRANAVAQALTRMGVPPRDIRVEAAPASASERPRAEVFMQY